MERQGDPTDLTDGAWALLEPHLPPASPRGRPRVHRYRVILNALFYLVRGGCAWRLLPPGAPWAVPSWQTVYHSFRRWRDDGTWAQLNTVLREQLRVRQGRAAQPSAGIVESQSVQTTGVGGPRGDDGSKQINGRTRHVLVDTQGLVLRAAVHEAAIADRDGMKLLLPDEASGEQQAIRQQFPRLTHLWLAGGYNGAGRGKSWVEQALGWTVDIVTHPRRPRGVWARDDAVIDWAAILPPPGFRGVLPRRRVVERTCAWLGQNRRLSKDFERLSSTGEALIYVAMARLMVRRLART